MPRHLSFSIAIVITVIGACIAVRTHEASAWSAGETSRCVSADSDPHARVLSFDGQRTGTALSEYDGVDFDETAVVDEPPMGAHSGRQAARSQDAGNDLGSAGQPIRMRFDEPQRAVGMFVGREDPGDGAGVARVRVTGYGINGYGTPSVLATAEIELAAEPIRINRCITIEAPDGTGFSSVTLDYMTAGRRSLPEPRWFDDLTLVPADASVPFIAAPVATDAGAVGVPPRSGIESPASSSRSGGPWALIAIAGLGLAIASGCIGGLMRTGVRTAVRVVGTTGEPSTGVTHRNVEELRRDYERLYGPHRAA